MADMSGPDKGGFAHFFIKEVFEQPRAVRDTVLGRISSGGAIALDGMQISPAELRELRNINIVASGSSRHAGMAGRYMIQQLAGVPVDVDYASEFEHRAVTGLGELTIVITQSGETADTSSAQRKAREKGSRTLAITNVRNSAITREADAVIYTQAGPEVSIASSKTFTAQLSALFLFALYLGEVRGALTPEHLRQHVDELLLIPDKLVAVLAHDPQCDALARLYYQKNDFLFIGRGIHYPIAMDGALKLKEISYIHAEGYPAGEIKHGPYALIDQDLPLVALATRDPQDSHSAAFYEKTVAGLKEVRKRGGLVIAVAVQGDNEVPQAADHVIFIPTAPELLLPVLEIVPLQLLAYHIAVYRGCDVDRPRNLVKAVLEE